MKWLIRITGIAITAALVCYFIWFAVNNVDAQSISHAIQSRKTQAALVACMLCHMLVYPLTSIAWRQLLLRQGQTWRSTTLFGLLGVSQLAKYIPGNIAQHAGRAALSVKHGMPLQPFVTTTIQETLLALSASIIVGTILLLSIHNAEGLTVYKWPLALFFVGSICIVGIYCLDLWPSRSRPSKAIPGKFLWTYGTPPGLRTTSKALTIYVVNYLLIGVGIWLISQAMDGAAGISYPAVTAAFALSWALGFLAPGAPAGIGAREGIMILLLQGHTNETELATLTVLARAASMAGDFAIFLIAALFARPAKTGVRS